jgi:hypothetical protein
MLDIMTLKQHFTLITLVLLLVITLATGVASFRGIMFLVATLYLMFSYYNYIEYDNHEFNTCVETKTFNSCGCKGLEQNCYVNAFESDPDWLEYRQSVCNGDHGASHDKLLASYGQIDTLKNQIVNFQCGKISPLQHAFLAAEEYVSPMSGFPGVTWTGFIAFVILITIYMIYQAADAKSTRIYTDYQRRADVPPNRA